MRTVAKRNSIEQDKFVADGLKAPDKRVQARLEVESGRETRDALRESENKFRDLVEKSLIGVYLVQDGVFKYVNGRNAEIHGYTVDELIDKRSPLDLVFHEDRPIVENNIRKRVLGRAESLHYEFRGLTKTNEVIDVEVFGSRTMYQGRPAVIGTLLDITERKRAEELLRNAEEKYRGIFENAIEGIFRITAKGRFVAANPALIKMLGYDPVEANESFLAENTLEICTDPQRRSEFMNTLEKEGVARGFECELHKRDMSKIRVLINAGAIKDTDGAIRYYEGTIEDITNKKKVEDELRLLNEFNNAIIDNAPVAIFTLDRKGVFTRVNPALASLSGLGHEVEKKLIGFNWVRNPYTIKSGLAAHIRRGLKGEPFQLWDFPFINYKGDSNHYVDFKGVPLKGKDGAVEGLLCIIEDTTNRVKTRAKLMQEAKIAAIGRLGAGVAHELNNPLATLVAYSELASGCLESFRDSNVENPELDELRGYLDIIEAQAFRCKNVVGDLLNLNRKGGLAQTDVNLNRLIEDVLEVADIEKPVITVVKDLMPQLPPVRGDLSALRQVFMNLVSNAIDAVEGRMDARLWVKTSLNDKHILVEVGDNGVGIPYTILDKIFEPFFTTKEAKKGIGLGLSLCNEFVNDLSGTIRVESKPGYGTTFFVSLPIYQT